MVRGCISAHGIGQWAMSDLILHNLQQRGFTGTEYVCLIGLPAVQICVLLGPAGLCVQYTYDTERNL